MAAEAPKEAAGIFTPTQIAEIGRDGYQEDKRNLAPESLAVIQNMLFEYVRPEYKREINEFSETYPTRRVPDQQLKRHLAAMSNLAVDINTLRILDVDPQFVKDTLLRRNNSNSLVSRVMKRTKGDRRAVELAVNSIISIPEAHVLIRETLLPRGIKVKGLEANIALPYDDMTNKCDFQYDLGIVETPTGPEHRLVRVQVKATNKEKPAAVNVTGHSGRFENVPNWQAVSAIVEPDHVDKLVKSSNAIMAESQARVRAATNVSLPRKVVHTGVVVIPYLVKSYEEIEETNVYGVVENPRLRQIFSDSLIQSDLFFTNSA